MTFPKSHIDFRVAEHVELCRMRDSSVAVLEGLAFSCMEGEQGHEAGGEGHDPTPAPPPGLTQECPAPWPPGILFVMGSAKGTWTP